MRKGGRMAKVRVSYFWYQKHPMPGDRSPDFKWYPAPPPRDLARRLDPSLPRVDGLHMRAGDALWAVSDEAFLWVAAFQASAENRPPYTGQLVVNGELIAPDTAAWADVVPTIMRDVHLEIGPVDADASHPTQLDIDVVPDDVHSDFVSSSSWTQVTRTESVGRLASSVYRGGDLELPPSANDDRLPFLGSLLAWLPAKARISSRHGCFRNERAGPSTRGTSTNADDSVIYYLARSWIAQGADGPDLAPVSIWRAIESLTESLGLSLEEVFTELIAITSAFRLNGTTADLLEYLLEPSRAAFDRSELDRPMGNERIPILCESSTPRHNWGLVLFNWGIGEIGKNRRREESARRLATVIAFRVLLDQLQCLDGQELSNRWRILHRAELESLLGPQSRELLLANVSRLLGPLLPADTFLEAK